MTLQEWATVKEVLQEGGYVQATIREELPSMSRVRVCRPRQRWLEGGDRAWVEGRWKQERWSDGVTHTVPRGRR